MRVMGSDRFIRRIATKLLQFVGILALFVTCTRPAFSDFWSLVNKGQPETTKLTRKLPAVAARNGNTVRFIAEIAGPFPNDTAVILREKIRTLLLHSKTGEIQLVDGPADTEIKCILTSYEPKVLREGQRQVGTVIQKTETWIGNIGASVQVLDNHNHPLDAANLKHHLENDFVISQQNAPSSAQPSSPFGIKVPQIKIKGHSFGNAPTMAAPADAGARGKGGRPPTESEWRESLIEGLAAKVANRIVPVDDEFVAVLPVEKEFAQLRELAKTGHWGNLQEQTEKMGPLSGGNEADRLYMLGLSYEAGAYGDSGQADQAADALTKASKFYTDASQLKPSEREYFLAQLRAQDSLDHYTEIKHFEQSRKPSNQVSQAKPSGGSAPKLGFDNDAVVAMTQQGMDEHIILNFIQNATDPKFDASASGLMELGRERVSANVIGAIQKKMAATASATQPGKDSTTQPAARTSRATSHRVSPPKQVQ